MKVTDLDLMLEWIPVSDETAEIFQATLKDIAAGEVQPPRKNRSDVGKPVGVPVKTEMKSEPKDVKTEFQVKQEKFAALARKAAGRPDVDSNELAMDVTCPGCHKMARKHTFTKRRDANYGKTFYKCAFPLNVTCSQFQVTQEELEDAALVRASTAASSVGVADYIHVPVVEEGLEDESMRNLSEDE
jgi:hypothetical protein